MPHPMLIDLPSTQAFRCFAARPITLGSTDLRLKCCGNRVGDLILKGKNIFERPLISASPDVSAVFGFDELSTDAQTIRCLSDAAFQNVSYTKFAAHLLHINSTMLVGESGRS